MSTENTTRIGVTGHRVPPKLPEASEAPLRAVIDRILADLSGPPRTITIVSALAEGSDRIVADSGLAAGFNLEVIIPFKRAEYMRDFKTPESRAEFDALLARASSEIELEGASDDRPHAYEAAGLAMLARIRVLFAIWDGKPAAGVGGTEEIIRRAIADDVLVVWIEPTNPDAIRLSLSGARHGANPTALADSFSRANTASATLAINNVLARPTA